MLDVTAQKELEGRLRSANDVLELHVLERTSELEETNEMMSLEIGERRRIEEELRATKERYRRLVEDVPAVVYVWQFSNSENDPQYYTSPQIERLLGFSVEEWNANELWIERLHPDDRDRVIAAAERSRSTAEPFDLEYRLFARDGHIVWVLDHATLLSRDAENRPYLFQGVLIDITARKEAEEKAALAEERYRVLSEESPAIGYEYVLDRAKEQVAPVYLNPRIATVMGDAAVEEPSRWIDRIHPDDRGWLVDAMHEHWDRGEPWHADLRVIASDGHIVWLYAEDRCVGSDDRGRPERFRGLMLDITERKLREEAVRSDLQRFKGIVEQLPGIPWIEVVESEPGNARIVYFGPQLQSILGYAPEELMAEPEHGLRIMHPDDRDRVTALSAGHDRNGQPWSVDFRVLARDGRTVWLRTVGQATLDELGRTVRYGISFDVTRDYQDVGRPHPRRTSQRA
jgi:PAS domain S-box-containing protein